MHALRLPPVVITHKIVRGGGSCKPREGSWVQAYQGNRQAPGRAVPEGSVVAAAWVSGVTAEMAWGGQGG